MSKPVSNILHGFCYAYLVYEESALNGGNAVCKASRPASKFLLEFLAWVPTMIDSELKAETNLPFCLVAFSHGSVAAIEGNQDGIPKLF